MDNISSKYAKATYSTVVFIIVVLIFWGWRSNSIPAYHADKGWNDFKCIKPIESAPGGGR